MDREQQITADQLVRALGALGLAQEESPGSGSIQDLTARAEHLLETLTSIPASRP